MSRRRVGPPGPGPARVTPAAARRAVPRAVPRLSEVVSDFLLTREASGRTAATVGWYAVRLGRLVAQLGDPPADRVTPAEIRRWLVAVKTGTAGREVRDSYVEGHRKAAAAMFAFAERERILRRSPMAGIAKYRIAHRELAFPGRAEIARLLGSLADRGQGRRNRAMIAVLYDCGVRVGELVHLTLRDARLERGELVVRGKTGEGTVPISASAAALVRDYLERYRPASPYDALFLSRDGAPLHETAVNQWLRRLARRAGIERGIIHPHAFRHAFATDYLRNGGDALTLQKILRHRTADMTRRYVHLASADVQARHRLASPFERLGDPPPAEDG